MECEACVFLQSLCNMQVFPTEILSTLMMGTLLVTFNQLSPQ